MRNGNSDGYPQGRRAVIGWAFYDWANSAFATTVLAGFFPVFFNEYWSAGVETTTTTARLGLANSIAGVTVAVLAPVLGAIADRGTLRKRLLVFFAFMGALLTCSLSLVAAGAWGAAIALFVFASVGFSGSIVFSDSLLGSVAPANRLDRVSALGYALGYLGGGLLFAVNVWMTLRPQAFGLRDAAQAVRLSFVTVGCWWALFTVPLILFVREPAPPPGRLPGGLVSGAFRELGRTFSHVRRLRTLFLFLLAYWCYIDGVDTIVRMAVDYGLSIGLVRDDLIVALLVTQFVGFPAALLFGRIGDRFGARRGIFAALGVYLLVTAWAALMQTRTEFFALAVAIGLVQGGIQALSRSYYARMLPAGRQAEFFGFYNMIGKFAAVIGPLLIGGSGLLARRLGAEPLAATRIGITSIALLFVVGGSLLRMVDEDRARLEALSLFGAGRSGNAADS